MTGPITYFIYARKSTEDQHRQVASIQDQLDALQNVIQREGLVQVGLPFTEAKSAKDPGRKVFNEMLDRIRKGEANAILTYDADRLSRNPIDNGQLQWMLQKSIIKVIKTPVRSFYPDDAGLLMSIEGGRSTDYVLRLSKVVKRGMRSRVAKGIRPNMAALGYKNIAIGEKGEIKDVVPDPGRFELVRRMWDMFLSGTYTVEQIRTMANEEWGFRTVKRKKLGGKKLGTSHMYQIFNNPFYYGEFTWKNPETGEREMHKGIQRKMITEAEFMRGQALLGNKAKFRNRTYISAFTGLMQCGECSSAISLDMKHQMICSICKYKFAYKNKEKCPKCETHIEKMKNPKILQYIYYHCTKRKNRSCSQGSILEQELERQISHVLSEVTIDDDYLNLALEYLADKRKREGKEEHNIQESLQAAHTDCQTRLKNLEQAYISPQNSNFDLYKPEEFGAAKRILVKERESLEKKIADVANHFDRSIDETARVVNFCHLAKQKFAKGDHNIKREIFSGIGTNLTLTNKKLIVNKLHPYLLIENELQKQRGLRMPPEPGKSESNKGRNGHSRRAILSWLPDLDSNQDTLLQRE
jgi:site-specific DNA recombinase